MLQFCCAWRYTLAADVLQLLGMNSVPLVARKKRHPHIERVRHAAILAVK